MLPAPVLSVVRRELEARLRQLNEEIRAYPQPIARCDVQLGALIEQRSEIAQAIAAVDAEARFSTHAV
jgi:hypothetical protein